MGERPGPTYAVVTVQIVGNPSEWEHVYHSDNVRSYTRKKAIQRGWRNLGHDDFLLARLDGDTLLGMSWQYEDRDPEDDESDDVAAQCGWLRPSRASDSGAVGE